MNSMFSRATIRFERTIRPRVPGMILALLAWLVLAVVTGCSDDKDRLAGSGSVTTNGVKGTILRDGLPASGVRVSLYAAEYDPVRDGALPESRRLITDRSGGYRFENLPAGDYNLIAEHLTDASACLLPVDSLKTKDSLRTLPDLALLPTGSILVRLPEDARESGGRVYLPGTGRSLPIDSAAAANGDLVFSQVPAGVFSELRYAPPAGASERNILGGPLTVRPEVAAHVNPFELWQKGYRITVNTGATGANVGETETGFPLLVRLTAANFSFDLAAPDGSDLRVTQGDSATTLPFELETWDPVGRVADLWVRADTLKGGNSDQFLCLYAGKIGAKPLAGKAAVFDTGAGFTGVWHLGESPVQAAVKEPVIRDRTAHGFHGIPGGAMTGAASVSGIIGNGLELDGVDDQVELPASRLFLPVNDQNLTLSAWIRPTAIQTAGDSVRHRLLSFKTDTAGLSTLAWGVSSTKRMSHYNRVGDSVYHWDTPLTENGAYHVALVFSAGTYRGYVNGILDFTVSGTGLEAGGTAPTMLGSHLAGNRNFQGLIDEVRIERTPRSAGWIALSYATQRPGATSVKVEAFVKP
jgi:hypothetical protein